MTSHFRVPTFALGDLPAAVLVGMIRVYQTFISPMTGPTCKYYPSCSQYAVIALKRHGALRGLGLALWRLLRCNPWSLGGVDDVPPARGARGHDDTHAPHTHGA
ncbi:membrane protein insertion efficiency factor YidD [Antribacter gilvus]|uniref:membrane protein insertion efficiency factor YidD n=1 Tax=Antribacter gilvus TaxID=2304675 RepID=UPI000F78BAF9|nr:membrane protein insertion efficiency factor YidD [Antribacter gilvus]